MIVVTGAKRWAKGINKPEMFELLRAWFRAHSIPGADSDLFMIQGYCEDSGEMLGQIEIQPIQETQPLKQGAAHVA